MFLFRDKGKKGGVKRKVVERLDYETIKGGTGN